MTGSVSSTLVSGIQDVIKKMDNTLKADKFANATIKFIFSQHLEDVRGVLRDVDGLKLTASDAYLKLYRSIPVLTFDEIKDDTTLADFYKKIESAGAVWEKEQSNKYAVNVVIDEPRRKDH